MEWNWIVSSHNISDVCILIFFSVVIIFMNSDRLDLLIQKVQENIFRLTGLIEYSIDVFMLSFIFYWCCAFCLKKNTGKGAFSDPTGDNGTCFSCWWIGCSSPTRNFKHHSPYNYWGGGRVWEKFQTCGLLSMCASISEEVRFGKT